MCMIGMVFSEHVGDVEPLTQDGWRDQRKAQLLERRAEDIPHYMEQLKECVQKDMIPVGRPNVEQVSYKSTSLSCPE